MERAVESSPIVCDRHDKEGLGRYSRCNVPKSPAALSQVQYEKCAEAGAVLEENSARRGLRWRCNCLRMRQMKCCCCAQSPRRL
eukprot:1751175-Pyramimonas_sp.AAC.1